MRGFLLIPITEFWFDLQLMKRIGVFCSGGDSPGMNACIRAVVRTGIALDAEVIGIRNGYQGMLDGDFIRLNSGSVSNIIQVGGTILKTSRCKDFLQKEGRAKAAKKLREEGIEGLICIGGDGTYTGAMLFEAEHGIPCIGCPGTIDNDLFGTDYTIGFHTAVNTAMEAIDRIRDTAESHARVFFIEVMGRHSGHLALQAGLASGAEGIFIPEKTNEMQLIVQRLKNRKRKKAFSIFIVAEGDEEGRAFEIANEFQKSFPETETRVSVLGYIQRGGSPVPEDRILATRLGCEAVQFLLKGGKNMAAGIIGNQIQMTPLQETIQKKKDVPLDIWAINELLSH